ncbi:hypothetical protein BC826DRAFT_52931 [Russula brevipes]|nr:hypothetical protein BC826DRAFT_52931 [Russula brevipes]
MKHAIRLLEDKVKARGLKSMHTSDAIKNAGRKRARAGDEAQLRAQGYKVKSDVVVDDKGIELELISKRPDHILTVYRRKNPDKQFIAKKVRKTSDELEILKLFDNMIPKPDHVIPLIESFGGKVVQVCLGLIQGVAYLHVSRVAHRDIKPDNLVVDRDFCLKIIDFDAAMRVKDEDEEVDDHAGRSIGRRPRSRTTRGTVRSEPTDGPAGWFFCTCFAGSRQSTSP